MLCLLRKIKRSQLLMRISCLILALIFTLSGSGLTYAAVLPYMPQPNQMISPSAKADLPYIVGMRFSSSDIFKFTFILNTGMANAKESQIRPEAEKIGKYFLAALTIPEKDIWVNLSPYEQERITTPSLGMTDLGKDMLGEDYVLKQLSSSLTCPDSQAGKQFWDRVYSQIQGRGGSRTALTKNDVINTFNKIWIVPNKIKITEANDRAVISEASLKVMTEADYLAAQQNGVGARSPRPGQGNPAPTNNSVAAMRDVIVPIIEQEVNTGKNFAQLRQLYRSIIMAAWYKKKLQNTVLNQVYFNKEKIKGADVNDPKIKEKIYNEYVTAFKQGVYNIVKREYAGTGTGSPVRGSVYVPGAKIVKRQYFSGGVADLATVAKDSVAHPATAPAAAIDAEVAQAAPEAQRDAEGMELQLTGKDGQPLGLTQASGWVTGRPSMFEGFRNEPLGDEYIIHDDWSLDTDASIDAVLTETKTRTADIEAALRAAEKVRPEVRKIRARVGKDLTDEQATRLATAKVLGEMQVASQNVSSNPEINNISWAHVAYALRHGLETEITPEVRHILDKAEELHAIGAESGLGHYTPEDIKAKLKGGTDLGLTPAAAYACCRAEAWGSASAVKGEDLVAEMKRRPSWLEMLVGSSSANITEAIAQEIQDAIFNAVRVYGGSAASENIFRQNSPKNDGERTIDKAVKNIIERHGYGGDAKLARMKHATDVSQREHWYYDSSMAQNIQNAAHVMAMNVKNRMAHITERVQKHRDLPYGNIIVALEDALLREGVDVFDPSLDYYVLRNIDLAAKAIYENKLDQVQASLRPEVAQAALAYVSGAETQGPTGGLDFANAQNIQIEAANGGVKLLGKEAVDYLVSGQVTGARLVNTGLSL